MSSTTDETMLKALLHLLDDPDPEVFSEIENKVIEIGPKALPYLKDAAEGKNDQLSENRITTLLNKIQYNKTETSLLTWKKQSDQKLIDAAVILSQYHYPNLEPQDIQNQIDKLKQDVWLELSEEFTPLEKIHILNHVFYKIYNFKGNKTNISHPQNSLLKDLLENRQGNSVILSILYLEVAQSLELPVFGVNLPENFILAYLNSGQLHSESKPLFYINPFNNGIVFTKEDIDTFLGQLDLEPNKEYFEPCNNKSTIERLMNELMQSYELSGDMNQSEDFRRLITKLA